MFFRVLGQRVLGCGQAGAERSILALALGGTTATVLCNEDHIPSVRRESRPDIKSRVMPPFGLQVEMHWSHHGMLSALDAKSVRRGFQVR